MTYKKEINNSIKTQLLSPEFVTGFVETDGCFSVSLQEFRDKVYWKPVFYITQKTPFQKNEEIPPILKKCKEFFAGGKWVHDKRYGCYSLAISNLEQLKSKVLPHFQHYPLLGEKARDAKIFSQIIERLLELKPWSKPKGLMNLSLSPLVISMNRTGKRFRERSLPSQRDSFLQDLKYASSFCQGNHRKVPDLHPSYVSGLIQGDGGFHFSFLSNPPRARPTFALGQHTLSLVLLFALKKFFSSGSIYQVGKYHWRYTVSNLGELEKQIIPHFTENPLLDDKGGHFRLFCKGMSLNKQHSLSSKEKLAALVTLLYDSNAGGKRRRLSKAEYLRGL